MTTPRPQAVVDLGAYRARRNGEEPCVRIQTVAQHYDLSVRTIERWAKAGMRDEIGLRLGTRCVRYRLSEVEGWVARNLGSSD